MGPASSGLRRICVGPSVMEEHFPKALCVMTSLLKWDVPSALRTSQDERSLDIWEYRPYWGARWPVHRLCGLNIDGYGYPVK